LEQFTANGAAERITGVPDNTFNLVALLHNKLEAIVAVQAYISDAERSGRADLAELLANCRAADLASVQYIRRALRAELGMSNGESEGDDRGGDLTPTEYNDRVDDEADASFPASDPPSFSGTTAE
jgi:hypothetical protein